jgi:hypothetical protein
MGFWADRCLGWCEVAVLDSFCMLCVRKCAHTCRNLIKTIFLACIKNLLDYVSSNIISCLCQCLDYESTFITYVSQHQMLQAPSRMHDMPLDADACVYAHVLQRLSICLNHLIECL